MKRSAKYPGGEVKLLTLREPSTPCLLPLDTPNAIAALFHHEVMQAGWYDPMKECLVVFLLTTRRRLIGWNLVSLGTLDTIMTHPREVFRPAIVAAASAIVLAHNHPSGDPSPSDADIRVTREMGKAAKLLKIDLLDHLVIGSPQHHSTRVGHVSLREMGVHFDS